MTAKIKQKKKERIFYRSLVKKMKYIKQFFIIIAISFLGEVLKWLLPFPVPASIYGLVLLFLALACKIIRLEQVEETADFLIEIMPLMFIPPGVKLLVSWGDLKPVFLQVVVIMVVSTVAVMVSSGLVTQAVLRRKKKRKEMKKENE
jgi:holin-like protein